MKWQKPKWMALVLVFLVFRSYISFQGFLDEHSWCHAAIYIMTLVRALTAFFGYARRLGQGNMIIGALILVVTRVIMVTERQRFLSFLLGSLRSSKNLESPARRDPPRSQQDM